MIDEKQLEGMRSRLPPESMRDIFRIIDTPIGDYIEILDTVETLWKENAELKQALSGRTVSCFNCNKLEAVARAAGDVLIYLNPSDDKSDLELALAALKEP